MLIGLISDTHIPDRNNIIPDKVFDAFKNVDLILHSGDITNKKVIEELEKIAPVKAIKGNMDKLDLPEHLIITVKNKKIGLIHGQIYPRGDTQQLYYIAKELDVDILISGHSHQPLMEQVKDVLLLNPGSPTVPRLADRTVMILEITEDINVDLIKIGSPVCSALNFFKR